MNPDKPSPAETSQPFQVWINQRGGHLIHDQKMLCALAWSAAQAQSSSELTLLRDKLAKAEAACVEMEKRLIGVKAENGRLNIIMNAHGFNNGEQLLAQLAAATAMEEALFTAMVTIGALHGEIGWPEYQHSPEMMQINSALANYLAATKEDSRG